MSEYKAGHVLPSQLEGTKGEIAAMVEQTEGEYLETSLSYMADSDLVVVHKPGSPGIPVPVRMVELILEERNLYLQEPK